MSTVDFRVQLANDVLHYLSIGRFQASKGSFLKLNGISWKCANEKLQRMLQKKDQCKVCAAGALFAACVLREDGITVGESFILADLIGHVSLEPKFMVDYLKKYFSEEQVKLIEVAFECGEGYFHIGCALQNVPFYSGQLAAEFGRVHKDYTERMIAIMENIVQNNGVFIP